MNAGLHFFSAQELTSCAMEDGCAGGTPSAAFYFMKYQGVARESCSQYRMRCFVDNSMISVAAADSKTSSPKSSHFEASSATCPIKPDPTTSPCRCLPSVYHLARPVECHFLP